MSILSLVKNKIKNLYPHSQEQKKEKEANYCKNKYDEYCKIENVYERIVEKNSIVKCKVPTENGPICCTAFPALYYSPTKDTIYENIYEGKIVDNKGNVVYMNFIKDYFVERQDVWYTGFIMKDGAFEKLNPAQLSPEHNKLIKNIVHTYETLEEEYSKEIEK